MTAEAVWQPSPEILDAANITAFARSLGQSSDYADLHAWSVAEPESFWRAVADYFDVRLDSPTVLAEAAMPGAQWFPGARVNYAGEVLRRLNPARPVVLAVGEDGVPVEWSAERLRDEVGAFAAYLRGLGVSTGDRVVGYLGNMAEALVAFLGTASVGAVWAVCNQDVGVASAADRLGQLEPMVLVAADGYRFNGKDFPRVEDVAHLAASLPGLKATVVVTRLGEALAPGQVRWSDVVAQPTAVDVTPVPFDHPLWVLFSSGTTGAPKGIVHGHGGVLLEHLKALSFHCDLGPEDTYLWYSSTSWMMWNFQVSGLLTGSTIVLYDGAPNVGGIGWLFELAARLDVSVFGASAGYLMACEKAAIAVPSIPRLKSVGSTGSPLPEAGFRWVVDTFGVPVNSISGGTDVVTAFIGHAPTLPVFAGEISGPCLGVAVEAWDDTGRPVVGEVGELVVPTPMPSMPIYFWNDPDGSRYRDAYFDVFPGVWRHGDWITVTERGSIEVHGRSDATLNRGGVRIGSAEIYQAVESLDEVVETLCIGLELADGNYWLPLFVHTKDGVALDDALKDRLRAVIREKASPRHVPDEFLQVPAVPHTLTGKRLEVPVKKILRGADPASTLNLGSVDRPELLDYYAEIARTRRD